MQVPRQPLTDEADAVAVCAALETLAAQRHAPDKLNMPLHRVIQLFQDVRRRDCPAFHVIVERGTPILIRIVEEGLANPPTRTSHDVFIALKMLAHFGTASGTEAVIRAARLPLDPDGFMWGPVLSNYTRGHPAGRELYEALANPLPPRFIGMALLDAANARAEKDAEFRHPFDSAQGASRLKDWLSDPIPRHYTYGVSSAKALAFLNIPARDELLSLALQHADPRVRAQAARSSAQLGRDAGVQWLSSACMDVHLSRRVMKFLDELGRSDAIPESARDPAFAAMAAFSNWVAQGNDMRRPPDDLRIIDHRELRWPPQGILVPCWLVQFRSMDLRGKSTGENKIGLAGSTTVTLESFRSESLSFDDMYAMCCYWDMSARGLICDASIETPLSEYDHLLRAANLAMGEEPSESRQVKKLQVVMIAEMAPELGYPQSAVAVAQSSDSREPRWFVADGDRSRWYSTREEVSEDSAEVVLYIHVGRVLLRFDLPRDDCPNIAIRR